MNPNLRLRLRTLPALIVLFVAVLFSGTVGSQADCLVKVTLLQLNDVYQFTPVDHGARGGIARVMTLKKDAEKENPNTLFLLAGDTISPSVESIKFKGAQMIESWNTAKLDYATFGNHEFDFGPTVLSERMKESRFGWLAANVIDRKTGKPFGNARAFVIREFNGVKVGIFGLVLQSTKVESRPGPDVDFLDPCETAKEVVSQIHDQGAKVVVALTHLSMGEDKKVARCANIDVIIGGHEHTLLQSAAGGAPIFKMTADARELGKIDLNISKDTGRVESIDWKVIPVTNQIPEDPEFAVVTNKYARLLPELARVLGRTSVPLDARSAEGRTRETNVGDFVTDALRKATAADVALINGGSIRADAVISPGVLTVRDVLSILPFKNKIVKLEISGATLRSAIEHGLSRSAEDAEPGRFPQVSGIQFSFDASRPAGTRIVDIKINGVPLDNDRKYTIATSNFLYVDGGDGYTMLKDSKLLVSPDNGPLDSDILQRAIASVRSIAPRVEGRIKRLDQSQRPRSDCNE
ncbi:MAG TPA: 5'-nucleotidase C-terminal domain-containing protein [Pyrinomonadaceae bacterium]|nr:5'-nucleotidase C-terminal domain-containing protein [Pyrinomonadaceae bacterium]